jgi:hypothetical protein
MSRACKLFRGAWFACFTRTNVRILTQKTLLDMGLRHLPVLDVQNRLLYWYKSTNTDAEDAARYGAEASAGSRCPESRDWHAGARELQ